MDFLLSPISVVTGYLLVGWLVQTLIWSLNDDYPDNVESYLVSAIVIVGWFPGVVAVAFCGVLGLIFVGPLYVTKRIVLWK